MAETNDKKRTAVALGDFDGMHLAHKTVVTGADNAIIYCVHNRFSLLQKSIFERRYPNAVFADFDEIKNLSGEEFIEKILLDKFDCALGLVDRQGRMISRGNHDFGHARSSFFMMMFFAVQKDATVYDPESFQKADIVLADVPCSGLGVIGKKQDIKYKMTEAKQMEIVRLQQKILHVVQNYVKPGGVLIYSTCTIGADENQMNIKWFLENYPFKLESIDGYICEELRSKTTKGGYLQLLPGIHDSDGFFIARLKRLAE